MGDISRRFLLKNGALALACVGGASSAGPAFLQHAAALAASADAPSSSSRRGKVLICCFQRGASDGLSMVAPFGDEHYLKLRTDIGLPTPAKTAGDDASVDLDGYFALHRRLAALAPIYRKGELAVIHACGSPNATRSHFDAQDFMEAGTSHDKSAPGGWLNRALAAGDKPSRRTPFNAVSMTSAIPRTMQGEHDVLAIPDLSNFGGAATGGFEGLYANAVSGGDVVQGAGKESFDALRMLKDADPAKYAPANGAKYPGDPFSRSLMQIAQLIKADLGVRVAFAEVGGWDTHANQGAANGQLAGRLMDFGGALAALHADLGDRMADVVVLTMTEFGRSVRQNGNRGTDHGHGACFLAMGGTVNGGKVLGDWPGLAPEKLFESRDLAVTTDYRDVLAEIAERHLGASDLTKVFPGFEVKQANRRGVLKA